MMSATTKKAVQKSENLLSPVHGGDIASASAYFCVPENKWLDLSTGINPNAYPIGSISSQALQQLPYPSKQFHEAAANYYGHENFVATNGTQPIIERLPALLAPLRVLLPEAGYADHIQAWTAHHSAIATYPALNMAEAKIAIERSLAKNSASHLVIINPNNPTGLLFPPELLHAWAKQLTGGGKLIVDEAFIDPLQAQSVLGQFFHENMIVLRSFGKFFGLAGVRLGYCFAQAALLTKLKQNTGFWDVNGPAQEIATKAFQDKPWIAHTVTQCQRAVKRRQQLIDPIFAPFEAPWQTHQAFFSTYLLAISEAQAIYQYFGQQGILLRYIPFTQTQSLLRVGQCDLENDTHIQRIQQAGIGLHRSSGQTI